ncbi:MAG: MFS transporter [Rickettsiales bacterium]|nr:MFS transporter [Rickettsiales bacterium]
MSSRVKFYPLLRLFASLVIMTVGATGMYAVTVSLKPILIEFESSRAAASLPYAFTMIGYGLGGILMGKISDKFGVFWTVLFAGFMLSVGFAIASIADNLLQLCIIQAIMIGLLGSGATFAPLVADASHWFTKRRGIAIGIVISGNYLAGAIWPPIIQDMIDVGNWRTAYTTLAVIAASIIPVLSFLLYKRPNINNVESLSDPSGSNGISNHPLGFAPNTLQCVICFAGIGCCIAMSVPQVHIIPYVTDLNFEARHGANMLAIMLGCGVISRIVSGVICDRIGGLNTLLLGSALQLIVLVLYLPFDSLTALYTLAALFGLSQGGIVPSYTIIIRTFFKAKDAGWRIGMALFFTMLGMAVGGWLAGALYDLTGSYELAFINAIGFNIANLAIATMLRQRLTKSRAATA